MVLDKEGSGARTHAKEIKEGFDIFTQPYLSAILRLWYSVIVRRTNKTETILKIIAVLGMVVMFSAIGVLFYGFWVVVSNKISENTRIGRLKAMGITMIILIVLLVVMAVIRVLSYF